MQAQRARETLTLDLEDLWSREALAVRVCKGGEPGNWMVKRMQEHEGSPKKEKVATERRAPHGRSGNTHSFGTFLVGWRCEPASLEGSGLPVSITSEQGALWMREESDQHFLK